ncbi:hypothetical protein D3C78_1786420 [compost metagenome]
MRSLRMMLTTPAIASEPYREDWPPGRTSMRSTMSIGIPLMLLNASPPLYSAGYDIIGRPLIRYLV